MGNRWKRAATAIVAVAVVVVFALWPASLGGATSYVSTRGASMEPRIRQGDLVLVREASNYRIGDVVAYRSEALGGPTVLHRIVDQDADGFITRGDNNDFLDPDRPQPSDLLGREWVHISGGARLVSSVRIALPALLGAWFMLRKGRVNRHRGRRPAHLASAPVRTPSSIRSWRMATLGGATATAVVVAIGLLAFARPATQTSESRLDYTQRGTFTYSADAPPGPVYSDGKVDTGDPIFLQLVDHLDVAFDYDFESPAGQEITGTMGVSVVLSNAAGWKHEVVLQRPQPFDDDDNRAEARLDINRFKAIVAEVNTQTGIPNAVTGVTVVPTIEVTGTVDGHAIKERFAPRLEFQLDALQLRPGDSGTAWADQLEPVAEGAITSTTHAPRHFTVLTKRIPVGTVRTSSLLFGLPLVVVTVAGGIVLQRRLEGEAARIELRHGHRIVPVTSRVADTVEVQSIQDLARMAEQYQALILQREAEGGGQEYQMIADGVVYRYRTKPDKPAPSRLLG